MKLWRYGQPIEVLGNRYRLEGILGSGGMAEVLLARDEQLKRWVAIKLLKTEELDQQMLNRFIKEAGQIAGWQHPHILRVYDHMQTHMIDTDDQKPLLFYMVMEYASGGDLHKRMIPEEPYSSLSTAFTIFRQICGAVQYAHKHGIIHRDIKPLNILFRQPRTGPEEAVLSDFGLAVQIDASHHTFAHAGTLAYMAPEQLRNQAQPASDIFALGVTLYQLCTGYLPFQRELKNLSYVLAGMEPDPIPPSQLNPDFPPELDEPILRALLANPDERYRSAAAFWNAIAAILSETQLASETRLGTPPLVQSPFPQLALGTPTEEMAEEELERNLDPLIRRRTNPNISQPQAIDFPSIVFAPSRTQATSLVSSSRQPASLSPSQHPPRPIEQRKQKRFPGFFLPAVIGAIILVVLAILAVIVPPLLVSSATITIIPRSQDMQNTFTFSSDQAHAHQISATATPQTNAGGVSGSIAAKKAKGQLTFINQTNVDVTIQSTILTDKNGVQISFNGPIVVPAINPSTAEATGFAVNAGRSGNIPLFDIDEFCCAPNNEIVVKNTTAFTGGTNAQPNDVVLQSDIDQAAKSLIDTQTQQEQAKLATLVQSNELAITSTEHCQPKVTSNPDRGTQATSVTVTVSVTCTEEVYDPSVTRTLATNLLDERAQANYQPNGQVTVSVLSVTAANNGNQTMLQIHAQGRWIYGFSQTRLKQLAALIAGKSQTEARNLLLRQAGIADVQFFGSGTLPSADHIQINVQRK